MNTFYEHHQHSIKLAYRCFDRILLNGLIQPFQQPERVIGFFNAYRDGERVTRQRLREIAQQFQNWVVHKAQNGVRRSSMPPRPGAMTLWLRISEGPRPTRLWSFSRPGEPARILTAIGQVARWHLQLAWRWIVQYSFYLCDAHWGRMFVRVCPYLPFSARVCLNQHHWLANKMRAEGIDCEQRSNAFLRCSHPEKLQALADSLTAHDLLSWLAHLPAALFPSASSADKNGWRL